MKKERIFWGLFFILGAVFLLFSQTEFMKGLQISIWNIIWTVFLVLILIKSVAKQNYFGIFFPLALLCVIYDEQLGITGIAPWTIFSAAILLSIGCGMIFPKKWKDSEHHGHWNTEESVTFDEIVDNDSNEQVRQEVNFGSCIKYINSDNFKSASFECNFGAMKIYFSNAIIQGTQATVFLENNFGGIELYIPKEWTVVNQIHSTFGGVDEKGLHQPNGTHTLYLHGECNFAGITINYI